MKQRSIVLVVSIVMGLFITTPSLVRAEDGPPADAPYQESVDETEMAEAAAQPASSEPVEASPTLPTAYKSPMATATTETDTTDQTSGGEAAALDISDNPSSYEAVTVMSPRKLPVSLTSTLTMRSILNSRIWSNNLR